MENFFSKTFKNESKEGIVEGDVEGSNYRIF